MRSRPAARLLVVDPAGRVLLFRFVHLRGPLAGQGYWATPGGEPVRADERYFALRTTATAITRTGWTALERELMTCHRWWSLDDLSRTSETVFPEDLAAILRAAAVG